MGPHVFAAAPRTGRLVVSQELVLELAEATNGEVQGLHRRPARQRDKRRLHGGVPPPDDVLFSGAVKQSHVDAKRAEGAVDRRRRREPSSHAFGEVALAGDVRERPGRTSA